MLDVEYLWHVQSRLLSLQKMKHTSGIVDRMETLEQMVFEIGFIKKYYTLQWMVNPELDLSITMGPF